MTNTASAAAVDLQVEQLHQHLSFMYQSMHDIIKEYHSIDVPEDIRERVFAVADRFLFHVANAAHEIKNTRGNELEVTRRAFINIRQAIFAFHDLVMDARERIPDTLALDCLHCLGMDILNAFHEAGPLLAQLGGWYYEGFRTESPWKPLATDPRLAECMVNE